MGGKGKLGNISKRGDRYLCSLFTTGALAVIRYSKIHGTKRWPWLAVQVIAHARRVAATLPRTEGRRVQRALSGFRDI